MEQARKRDRERRAERRAEEVKQRRKERDPKKRRAEIHAVRSCCSAPCCARGSGGWRVDV